MTRSHFLTKFLSSNRGCRLISSYRWGTENLFPTLWNRLMKDIFRSPAVLWLSSFFQRRIVLQKIQFLLFHSPHSTSATSILSNSVFRSIKFTFSSLRFLRYINFLSQSWFLIDLQDCDVNFKINSINVISSQFSNSTESDWIKTLKFLNLERPKLINFYRCENLRLNWIRPTCEFSSEKLNRGWKCHKPFDIQNRNL